MKIFKLFNTKKFHLRDAEQIQYLTGISEKDYKTKEISDRGLKKLLQAHLSGDLKIPFVDDYQCVKDETGFWLEDIFTGERVSKVF